MIEEPAIATKGIDEVAMKVRPPDNEMRAFLLGEMPADEGARLEARIFEDESAYDALLEARYDLVDDYVRNELSPVERRQVERRVLGTIEPEAMTLAEALARHRSSAGSAPAGPAASPDRAERPDWRVWAAAAAAVVAMATAGSLLVENRRLTADLDAARQTPAPAPPASSPSIASLRLSAQTTRSAEVAAATIPPDAQIVDVALSVDEALPSYQVAIEGRQGRVWFQRLAGRGTDGAVHVWVPAAVLPDDLVEFLVYGGPADTAPLLGAYPVRIQRP
jgi:hypothetical protein